MNVTRRQFVATAAAAPLILSAPALGRARRPANDRIGLGMIGMGKRMFEMLGPFLNHPDFQILAVCDVDTVRREHGRALVDEHYAKKGGGPARGCAAMVDYQQLLAFPGIDAVVISTPDHWHGTQVLAAAAAGKDIYCEKPLSHTLLEGKKMIDAVRKHGRVFQTGSQQRTEYGHRFVRACELVRNGLIGDVLTVHVGVAEAPIPCDLPEQPLEEGLDWDRWLGPAPMRPYHADLSPRGVHNHYPTWRRYTEYSGGYLADMGAHHFDIAQWALGADDAGPVRVEPPQDEHAMYGATLIYPSGVRLVHGGPSGTTFIGTKGVLAIDRVRLNTVPDKIAEAELPEDAVRLPRHASHIQNWADCIRSRQRCICDVEVGARSAAVCHLANLAYHHRRPMTWDPERWEFPGDSEANGWMDYQRRAGYELPAV